MARPSSIGRGAASANAAVDELVRLGILRPVNEQRRHRVFHAHAVMNAFYTGLDTVLDDAVRAGRFSG